MWGYEKRLQFPVNIKNPDARAAKVILSQYGGPDGELGASLRYLSQRYTMPYKEVAGLFTDIGIEVNYCALCEVAKDLPLLPLHTPPLDKPSTAGFRWYIRHFRCSYPFTPNFSEKEKARQNALLLLNILEFIQLTYIAHQLLL